MSNKICFSSTRKKNEMIVYVIICYPIDYAFSGWLNTFIQIITFLI